MVLVDTADSNTQSVKRRWSVAVLCALLDRTALNASFAESTNCKITTTATRLLIFVCAGLHNTNWRRYYWKQRLTEIYCAHEEISTRGWKRKECCSPNCENKCWLHCIVSKCNNLRHLFECNKMCHVLKLPLKLPCRCFMFFVWFIVGRDNRCKFINTIFML